MRLFLLIAVCCLALFVTAWIVTGELVPSWRLPPGPPLRGIPAAEAGVSLWAIVQNLSALVGIVSFLIQIVQWRRGA
jgi:hypothetical protein